MDGRGDGCDIGTRASQGNVPEKYHPAGREALPSCRPGGLHYCLAEQRDTQTPMSTPETDSILKECLLDYGKITEIISLCQKMERELNDIYSHLSATVPTEQRKAFLISIINQHKFNERGHDKIPRSLPCPNPYLLSDRVQINRTKSNG
jgi:hypothetical protein